MKKPESVVSVNNDVLVGISSYDAFVYEYTNIENGKKYVGVRLQRMIHMILMTQMMIMKEVYRKIRINQKKGMSL